MSNNVINLVGLDFTDIKSNLISYLKRSDSPFKDVDFEGSNINNLVDVLAYNTYQNSYYLNMVASEMFLDSALLKDSVVSHAKELNYVPRSFRSAEADISFVVTPPTAVSALVISKGTSFTTRVGSNNFTFSVDEQTTVLANTDDKFYVNLTVYEGTYLTDSFVYLSSNTTQRFVLSNPTVDTRSIAVVVTENNGANAYTYTRATSFLGVNSNSQVYFLQAAENDQYEIIFGDGSVGRQPKNGAVISVEYRVCNGELPNGARQFDIDAAINGYSNVSSITTTSPAVGGAINESINSIKFNAPRHFQNQERAVTSSDYESLLRANFTDVNDVSAYGGEILDPPVYGKVYVAVDVKNGTSASDSAKLRYYNFIKPRSPISIDPVFVDADYLYVEARCLVRYNTSVTSLKTNDISTSVTAVISQYNTDVLDGFKKTLRYSQLVQNINQAHSSIISNDLSIIPFKKISPITGTNFSTILEFGFALSQALYLSYEELVTQAVPSIRSTPITKDGKTCYIKDDGLGGLGIYTVEGVTTETKLYDVGTIDYATGKVSIVDLNVDDYVPASGSHIHLYVKPAESDITSTKNQIITIDDSDIVVTVEGYKL